MALAVLSRERGICRERIQWIKRSFCFPREHRSAV